MEIDWTKESTKVKEAVNCIVKAYNIHQSMDDTEKDRFDILVEECVPKEPIGA
jgi:phosphoenolpyruvate carboxylase